MNTELVKAESNRLQVQPHDSSGVEGLLRFAIENKAGVETIERMMAVRRELRAEEAKRQYDEALAGFQYECPIVMKTKSVKTNSGTKAYDYAPLENIIQEVKPFLKKHGFSYTLDTDVQSQQGWVIAKCIVKHCGGHSETSAAKFPMGTKTQIMSETQVYAAALTFASRRVFCNAFGIVTAGEDLDGATSKQKPAGPSTKQPETTDTTARQLAADLWKLLNPVRGNLQNWDAANQWLWKNDILDGATGEAAPNITKNKLRHCITKTKEILK